MHARPCVPCADARLAPLPPFNRGFTCVTSPMASDLNDLWNTGTPEATFCSVYSLPLRVCFLRLVIVGVVVPYSVVGPRWVGYAGYLSCVVAGWWMAESASYRPERR